MKKQWSLRFKLIVIFMIVGMLPLLAAILISSRTARVEITAQATERVKMVGQNKTDQVSGYFTKELSALTDLASSSLVATALSEFTEAFQSYGQNSLSPEQLAKLEAFYGRTFQEKYSQLNPDQSFDVKAWLAGLDDLTKSAQYDFIASNDNPLGEKNNLLTAARQVPYNIAHGKYHDELGGYVKRHGLYDVFLVSPDGRVVYTFFKEIDFGGHLSRGALAESGLGKAFAKSMSLAKGTVHLEDFAAYGPSYEAAASFAAVPVYASDKYLGSLVIQLPLDKINQAVSNRQGLGETGQVLLLGSDGLLRADAFRMKEKYNVAASFRRSTAVKIDLPIIGSAAKGESGFWQGTSYDGVKVLSYYQPLKVADQTWIVISELGQDEMFAGLQAFEYTEWTILLIAGLLIGVVAWSVGVYIGKKLQMIISNLDSSATRVSHSSTEAQKSSAQLSAAVAEQASSVQETMASAEEISAMINQNADSSSKAKTTVEANDQATKDGSRAVEEMVGAIGAISTTNEKILQQMEESNKEFAEIVRIISEIGEKTKVINDIVFQTKLLSFNASVEAARAGEHGKGFSVVAEEVGNLARMSGNAAKEIADMLSSSIKRVNSIVEDTKTKVEELVEIGRDKVMTGQSTANRCKNALELLGKNASTLTAMVTEIAHASKEQAQGVREINTAISQMDLVTQQNAAVAEQSSTQAQGLLSETHSLRSVVTELAFFVNGKGDQASQAGKGATESEGKAAVRTANAGVVSIASAMKKKADKKAARAAKGNDQAKTQAAMGSDVTPSANDPMFEDF